MTEETEKLKEMRKILIEQMEQYDNTLQDVKVLRTDPKVKEYIEKQRILDQLEPKIDDITLKIRQIEMENCNHIWYISGTITDWDGHRKDKLELRTCVKCDLSTQAVYEVANSFLTTDINRCMSHILNGHYYSYRGINTDIYCSPEIAKEAYEEIIKEHPNITDEEVVFYLKPAVQKLTARKTSDVHQRKRIKNGH